MRLPAGVSLRTRVSVTVAITSLLAIITPAVTRPAAAVDPRHVGISLATVATGLDSPVAMAAPNDASGRLFIVEQTGRIRVWTPHSHLLGAAYLDLRSKVSCCGERGLLGMVFHPRFTSNGYFYVYYTSLSGSLQISRFHATPSSNTADGSSEYGIINIAHPNNANHNGGQLQMWNGGYLYIGTGDGGGAGDLPGNAQNLKSLLGKILRIDVDHTCGTRHYCVPSTNPFYGHSYAAYEVWEFGLRNPWRFSFQRGNGTLWIGDVGQNAREEVDGLGPGLSGRNFGWDCYEGTLNTISTYGGSYCAGRNFVWPTYQYSHTNGRCAIIGGYMYEGAAQSRVMGGLYLFADYCTGEIWGMSHVGSHWPVALVGRDSSQVTSFGEGVNGELYVLDAGGRIFHINARAR